MRKAERRAVAAAVLVGEGEAVRRGWRARRGMDGDGEFGAVVVVAVEDLEARGWESGVVVVAVGGIFGGVIIAILVVVV